jgi:rifampicin phosphotransferase
VPFLYPDTSDLPLLGGKGAALARLGELGFEIPAWFAVPPLASFTPDELARAAESLGADLFAVRSSGSMEDGTGHSFAGQFESHLQVPLGDVFQKISEVRASSSSPAILIYCQERQLPPPSAPTVLVQRMITPRCAGVAFSADPVTGERGVAIVSAVEGTGEKLVAGELDGETWRIDRAGVILSGNRLLTNFEAIAIAELARHCEDASGHPQDIEWALDLKGKLWLLQSRPITTLGLTPDPADALRVWDNSNIAESYGGVTTPLTFSFARRIYESAYREFCVLMSVPQHRIERSDEVFSQMLGLVKGRVYYNLVSWYRVLALLPGFQLNRNFMEQMMGVREPLPDEIVERIVEENRSSRILDLLTLVRTSAGLISQLVGLPKQIARFQFRLDSALTAPPLAISRMSGEELVTHYRNLESQLLKKWDAPLINDFFAMIFYGVLGKLCVKWVGDDTGTLQNELLLDCGEIISAEPPRRIMKMAKLASRQPGLGELLADHEIKTNKKIAALRRCPELAAAFENYLEDFGDRCLEELKLESPTVRDDPSSLLISIGAMAGRKSHEDVADIPIVPVPRLSFVRGIVFNYVLNQAKVRVRSRENLRFERTRLFGRVRAILRELGHRLHADGLLNSSKDVFYLEIGEILAAWEGTGTTGGLGMLATLRRAEFAIYETTAPSPDRFQTRGPISRYENFENNRASDTATASLTGNGACPGRVVGRVRVVLDPRGARLEEGEILVARQTDPGWVVLFPAAAGLLVERGSLLSHSAIVAREMRLPCIVSLPGITNTLKTGDLIEMDGTAGTVHILQ